MYLVYFGLYLCLGDYRPRVLYLPSTGYHFCPDDCHLQYSLCILPEVLGRDETAGIAITLDTVLNLFWCVSFDQFLSTKPL